MSSTDPGRRSGPCKDCLRRSWLLGELSTQLEYQCRNRERLAELLMLDDEELIQAIGGRRRAELAVSHARFEQSQVPLREGAEGVCRHCRSYPALLTDAGAPWMLNVAGGVDRLRALASAPTVAIIGTTRATDYGVEMAKNLARGLAASGVTVASGMSDGIAVAALAGALQREGATLAVMAGGLDVACPAKRRSLYERVRRAGCAVTELPGGSSPRRWGLAAGERILARLAELTVVVEARDTPGELAGARTAQTLGKTVAAIPGRVTSPLSSGTHALLMGGAHLLRGPADALELLSGMGSPVAAAKQVPAELEPRLQATLDRVGAGRDTPAKLTSAGEDAGEVLLALTELELMGLLTRGDGGRYVPRQACDPR
jgi:DNA processing protein